MPHTQHWKWYVAVTALFAAALAPSLVPWLPAGAYREWLLFMALAVVAELSPVSLPDSNRVVSLGFAVVMASLLSLGPLGAVVTSVAGGLVVLFPTRSSPFTRSVLPRRMLSVGIIVGATACAAWVYNVVGGPVGLRYVLLSWWVLPPILLAGGAMAAANAGFVVVARAVLGLHPTWREAVRNLGVTVTLFGLFTPVAVAMAVIYPVMGAVGVFLFFLPLLMARQAFGSYMEMQNIHTRTLNALLTAVDIRHPYTAGHSLRVGKYAVAIGEALRLSKKDLRLLEYSAKLHDVGKLGVSEYILNKVEPLTHEELQQVKEHARMGSEVVSQLGFFPEASRIVLHHHEWYNGKGYPEGLKGREIPLLARIITVADSFDAITAYTPYKRALSLEEAILELERCAGSQMDPAIVPVFVKLLGESSAIRQVVRQPLESLRMYTRAMSTHSSSAQR